VLNRHLDSTWLNIGTGSYFHYLHHRYFKTNFGENTIPLDKWFGTFMDGVPEHATSQEDLAESVE